MTHLLAPLGFLRLFEPPLERGRAKATARVGHLGRAEAKRAPQRKTNYKPSDAS